MRSFDDEISRNGVVISCLGCRARQSFGNLTATLVLPLYVVCDDGQLLEIRLQPRAHRGTVRRSADMRIIW